MNTASPSFYRPSGPFSTPSRAWGNTAGLCFILVLLTLLAIPEGEPPPIPVEPVDTTILWNPIPRVPDNTKSQDPEEPVFTIAPPQDPANPVPDVRPVESPRLDLRPSDFPGSEEWVVRVPQSGPLVPTFTLEHLPRLIRGGVLEYPYEMRKEKIEGVVILQILIGTDGKVTVERVLNKTNQGFVQAAVKAAETSVFEPPMVNGRPARVRYHLPIEFSMQ